MTTLQTFGENLVKIINKFPEEKSNLLEIIKRSEYSIIREASELLKEYCYLNLEVYYVHKKEKLARDDFFLIIGSKNFGYIIIEEDRKVSPLKSLQYFVHGFSRNPNNLKRLSKIVAGLLYMYLTKRSLARRIFIPNEVTRGTGIIKLLERVAYGEIISMQEDNKKYSFSTGETRMDVLRRVTSSSLSFEGGRPGFGISVGENYGFYFHVGIGEDLRPEIRFGPYITPGGRVGIGINLTKINWKPIMEAGKNAIEWLGEHLEDLLEGGINLAKDMISDIDDDDALSALVLAGIILAVVGTAYVGYKIGTLSKKKISEWRSVVEYEVHDLNNNLKGSIKVKFLGRRNHKILEENLNGFSGYARSVLRMIPFYDA